MTAVLTGTPGRTLPCPHCGLRPVDLDRHLRWQCEVLEAKRAGK